MKDLLGALKDVDVLTINDEEARQLSGEYSLIKASKKILNMGPKYLIIKKGKPKAKKVSKVEAKVWPITYLPYSDKETILIKYIFKKKPITKLKQAPKILQLVCLIIKLSILIYLKMKLTD